MHTISSKNADDIPQNSKGVTWHLTLFLSPFGVIYWLLA